MKQRRRRFIVVLIVLAITGASAIYETWQNRQTTPGATQVQGVSDGTLAAEALEALEVKGRAPKTGYSRSQFGGEWADAGACDMRNWILNRDLTDVKTVSDTDCTVVSGTLNDPYTGQTIQFQRGSSTSDDVQIDHVVAVSDAWQKGAQGLSEQKRAEFYNDPLNLLAVDGPTNQKKGDGDAATWLPPHKAYRCQYIARQIAVKVKYLLWVTEAEKDAIKRVLQTCHRQVLP